MIWNPNWRRRIGPLALVAVVALASAVTSCGEYTFRGGVEKPAHKAVDLDLTDQDGKPFSLSSLQGKVVLVFFGYASCPDVCPTTMADLVAVKKKLGADGDEIRVVFVTVDPERDTQSVLKYYVGAFDPAFIGLRGPQDKLAPMMTAYHATARKHEEPGSAIGYTIDHSAFVYGIDKAGCWRTIWRYGAPIDDYVSDLRFLIQEKPVACAP